MLKLWKAHLNGVTLGIGSWARICKERPPRMNMEKTGGSSGVPELLGIRGVKSPVGLVLGISQLEQDRV